MLELRFGSIISRSLTDVGRTKLHTLDVQVTEGSPVFMKQYTIPLKYQNFITEKKAYTIYKAVKKFTFYITGAKTMVFRDHKPLKNFFEGGMNITKLDRWSLELQEFDISLEFIQGKLNTVADVISHLKNRGLYVEHSKEDQKVNTVTNLDDRIKEVLDIASKPLNFEKVFSMDTVISHKELLLC